MQNIIKYLWVLFLFTFPFSIRFLMYEDASYRFGNFNPWVSGFVYLPEVLLLVIFVLWIIYKCRTKDKGLRTKSKLSWILLGLFVFNAFVITLIKGDGLLAIMFLVRILEVIAIFLLISDKLIKTKKIITILLFSALFQIIWGLLQVILNHSVGLYFLGESIIAPEVLNVAKENLADGTKHIRAYGSFLHPNILAGYLLVVFFLALKYLKSGSRLFWFIIFIIGIYLTKSRAVMIVGTISLALYCLFHVVTVHTIRKWIVFAIMSVFLVGNIYVFAYSHNIKTNDISFQERLTLNTISKDMIKANPLGVGARNFTLKIESGAPEPPKGGKFLPWEFQPVHNVYFLVLNETGVQGLILLLAFIIIVLVRYWKVGTAIPLLILITLTPFDHFLWDSWVGMMMIGLVAGFFVMKKELVDVK